jgi:hypothetical protein
MTRMQNHGRVDKQRASTKIQGLYGGCAALIHPTTYSIAEHQHRFAAWAAATAARASKLCRFNVKLGVNILEESGFTADFSLDHLPITTLTDQTHQQWRNTVIDVAQERGLDFTHGVAAKLINCYLKGRFVCGGYADHERVQPLHPPIDSVLLKGLATRNVGGYAADWQRFYAWRWSKYSSEQYEEVIALIRQAMPGCPLWEIESYWQGHQ